MGQAGVSAGCEFETELPIQRFDVTQHPTAAWLSQQIIEAFPWETAPNSFLLRDRDASYGSVFSKRVAAMGIH
jgi:hypothetical protein